MVPRKDLLSTLLSFWKRRLRCLQTTSLWRLMRWVTAILSHFVPLDLWDLVCCVQLVSRPKENPQRRLSKHSALLPPGPNLVAQNGKSEDRTWSKCQGDGIGLNSDSMVSYPPCPGREPGWITPSDRQLCAPAGGSACLHPQTGHWGKWWSSSCWQSCRGMSAGGRGVQASSSTIVCDEEGKG